MNKKKHEITIRSSAAEYLTFIAATGNNEQSFEMRYQDENIWLTQKMMATLYNVSISAINQHLKKVFDDNEVEPDSVIKKYLITADDGKNYNTNHYNLQAIIAVGFKVNSERAVQFRKWVNKIAKDYTIQGWVMDEERLKNRARRRIPMTMEDWAKYLDRILQADDRELLTNAGSISAAIAQEYALSEFEKYRVTQDKLFESDFDRQLKRLEQQMMIKTKDEKENPS